MFADPSGADRINQYSLVSYIGGRLGVFLNNLRRELVSGCNALAHVTVLPPRPLSVDPIVASEILKPLIEDFPSFRVEITGIRIFETTDVIYADIGAGSENLLEMHDALSRHELYFKEPYNYHPHITLAQNLLPGEVQPAFEIAVQRWREESPPNSFEVSTLTFVQNTLSNCWIDLAECDLRGAPSLPYIR